MPFLPGTGHLPSPNTRSLLWRSLMEDNVTRRQSSGGRVNRAEKRAFVSQDVGEILDYDRVIREHPWLLERELNCILSPDADGFLSGLLMAKALGWRVRGFFDARNLLIEEGIEPSDCVFLDIEVFRKGIRSLGHHWLMPGNFRPYHALGHADTVNPHFYRPIIWNMTRGLMGVFFAKYPFGSVHLLLGLLNGRVSVPMPETGLEPLLFADGSYGNISSYGENCLYWSKFLGADAPQSLLHPVFRTPGVEFFEMSVRMEEFYIKRDALNWDGVRSDRALKTVMDRVNREPHAFQAANGLVDLSDPATGSAVEFIRMLGDLTGWDYDASQWTWSGLTRRCFTTRIETPRVGTFNDMFVREPYPICWAVTAGTTMECTVPGPDDML